MWQCSTALTQLPYRSRHAARSRLCYSQKLYLRTGALDGCCLAQGCQSAEGLGMADWQETCQEGGCEEHRSVSLDWHY